MANIYIGTELKLNIHIKPIETLTMDNYDFKVEIYCNPNKVILLEKKDLIRRNQENYIAIVDSTNLSTGTVKCTITAFIPDNMCEDGYRTEKLRIYTGINIIK